MRIVGGNLSGRVIKAPAGRGTRPTSDRVREAVFNIIAHNNWENLPEDIFEGAQVLDAFCGTGALAFECLSRGSAHASLFDLDKQALSIAKENAKTLGLEKSCTIMHADATRPPKAKEACNIIFLDPPYKKNLIDKSLPALEKSGWIAPHALIIAETSKNEELDLPEGFTALASRTYGDTAAHFMRHK